MGYWDTQNTLANWQQNLNGQRQDAGGGYSFALPTKGPAQQSAAGGGGGGGGFNPGYNPAVAQTYANQLASQWNQARAANQAQLSQMQGIAAGYGQGQIAQSNQLTQQQQAEGQQTMAQRGLYNSTVAQGVNMAAQNAGAIRNAGINDQTAQLQLGVLGQNQISYPNLSAYAQLASQPGAFSGNSGVSALLGAMGKFNFGGGAGGGGAPSMGGVGKR